MLLTLAGPSHAGSRVLPLLIGGDYHTSCNGGENLVWYHNYPGGMYIYSAYLYVFQSAPTSATAAGANEIQMAANPTWAAGDDTSLVEADATGAQPGLGSAGSPEIIGSHQLQPQVEGVAGAYYSEHQRNFAPNYLYVTQLKLYASCEPGLTNQTLFVVLYYSLTPPTG